MTATQTEIHKWTAQEFKRLVLDCNPKVAVFDCDGTLWGGDAGYGFMEWSLEQGLVSRSTSDWIDTRHRAYRAGKGERRGNLRRDGADLCRTARPGIARCCGPVRQGICPRSHLPGDGGSGGHAASHGVELWAVSSTNRWVVAEGIRDFGIPEVISLPRKSASRRPHHQRNPPRAHRCGQGGSAQAGGLATPDAVFGNSIHDLAMLEMSTHPFPVNPSPALLEAAAKNGWGYFRPAGRRGLAGSGGE